MPECDRKSVEDQTPHPDSVQELRTSGLSDDLLLLAGSGGNAPAIVAAVWNSCVDAPNHSNKLRTRDP